MVACSPRPGSDQPKAYERAGLCGDGITQTGETCDDGNVSNHDGCSATCEL
ncbi:MAG: DUF4215 domain-containing protein, partial [Planctomycetota bacterium]